MNSSSAMSLYPPRAHLVIAGEFDAYASILLRCRLDEAVAAGCIHFTVDLSAVTFVDAGGIGTLVRLINTVRPRGGTVEVCAASAVFRWVSGIVGLETVFGLDELAADVRTTSPADSPGRGSLEDAATAS